MGDRANVQSIQAIRDFRAATVRFHDEAERALESLVVEMQRSIRWIQLDRPQYWKQQVRQCHQEVAEARGALMKCQMRRTGDFKPTCFEERKAFERAKRRRQIAQDMIDVVRRWGIKSQKEADEFKARTAQLSRCLEGDLPRAVALLERIVESLEKYAVISEAVFDATPESEPTTKNEDKNEAAENEAATSTEES